MNGSDDQISRRFDDAAASIGVAAPDAALADVHDALLRRQRRRTALVGGVAAFALITAGGVLVVSLAGDDTPSTIRTVDQMPSTAPSTPDTVEDSAPDESVAPTESIFADTAPVVESVTPAGDATTSDLTIGDDQPVEWIVPWKDGFIAGRTAYSNQPLPTEFPEEISALFPQEVRDLFADGLPGTIQEATDQLDAAGLLDEVTAVIAEHPEASRAIYSQPSTVSLDAWTSPDGATWDPIVITLPEGVESVYGITSSGDRLTGIARVSAPEENSGVPLAAEVSAVVSTIDLTHWSIQPLPEASAAPDGFESFLSIDSVVANDDGWIAQIHQYMMLSADTQTRFPAEVQQRITEGGSWGMSPDGDGVTVSFGDDAGGEFGSTGDDSSLVVTWAELGIDPETVPDSGQDEVTYVSAAWDGVSTEVSPPPLDYPVLVATDAGAVAFGERSTLLWDGSAWTDLASPSELESVVSVLPFGDGVAVIGWLEDQSTAVYVISPDDWSWRRVSVAGLPERLVSYFVPTSGSPAQVLASMDPALEDRAVEPYRASVDVDGYRFTQYAVEGDDPFDLAYDLIDIGTGATVITEKIDLALYEDEIAAGGRGGDSYEFLKIDDDTGDMTFLDPDTGAVLVTIPRSTFGAAAEVAAEADADDIAAARTPLGFVLIATNGDQWILHEMAAGTAGAGDEKYWIAAANESGAIALDGSTVVHVPFSR